MLKRPSRWQLSRTASALLANVLAVVAGAAASVPSASASVAAGSPSLATARSTQSTDDWPTFGHDALHSGVSPDTAIGASHAPSLATKWARPVGAAGTATVASPAIAYNAMLGKTLVYDVNIVGLAKVFDAATGAVIWKTALGAGVEDSPAIDGNILYIGTDRGQLFALNSTTGVVTCMYQLPIFSPETAPGRIFSSPVVGRVDSTGPVVYFGDAGQSEKLNGGHEWAVNGVGNTDGDCTLKWVFNGFKNKGASLTKTGSWSSPALGQDKNGRWLVVFGSTNPDDSVYALDAVTGTKVWRFQTASGDDTDVGAGPTISAPGVNGFAGGLVYIDGKTMIEYTINLTTGRAGPWVFDLAADSGLKTNSVSCAALVGDVVVVAYSDYVYAFDAQVGTKLWRSDQTTGTILASVSVSGAAGDQVVMVGDVPGVEYAYRLSDGTLLFSMNVGHQIRASTAVSAGEAFFAAINGDIYALG